MMQMHALLRGSGYAKIISGPRGPVDKLIPIHPDRILEIEEIDEETLRYKILERDNTINTYLDDEIFELRGLTLDGIKTVSVITYSKESFGLALGAERFGAKLFNNYAKPSGFLKHPGNLSSEAQQRLLADAERNTGGENLHRFGILEEGMDFVPVTFTPEDSQMLETREFQAQDVCRWFKVPPHMVGLTSKATSWGSGIDELTRGFVTYTLMPWLVRWQQVIAKDLIIASESYYAEFLTDALLRGDLLKRYQAYSIGRNGGWLSTNDIRRAENMNPIENGDDDYLTALNMQRTVDIGDDPDQDDENKDQSDEDESSDTTDQTEKAHYQMILEESAGRVVRKEIAAMTKAAERGGSGWEGIVDNFCKNHVEFVAQTMRIPFQVATKYVENGRKELIEKGPNALVGWQNRRTNMLTRISMMEE